MATKRIPLKIVRDDAGFGQFDVLNERGEVITTCSSLAEARQYVLTATPNDDGEYEPDYDRMWEDRYGDPELGLDAAERSYERYLGRS